MTVSEPGDTPTVGAERDPGGRSAGIGLPGYRAEGGV